jgi:hypothetical protein
MISGQRFPYTQVKNARGETALRPILPLTLTYRSHSFSASALVDTGADVNVLPYKIGIELGAIWDERTTLLELSGNLSKYEARGILISATIGEYEPVQLAFAWTRAENIPVLLGQMNFFMEFDVCFYRTQGFFEIHPNRNS